MLLLNSLIVLAATASLSFAAGPSTSSQAAGRPPAGILVAQRDKILRTMFLEHPQWTTREIIEASEPVFRGMGYEPLVYKTVDHVLRRYRKEFGVSKKPARRTPEHLAFLKARFEEDPNQPVSAVAARFRAAFGPHALVRKPIADWWSQAKLKSRNARRDPNTPIAARNMEPVSTRQTGSESAPIN